MDDGWMDEGASTREIDSHIMENTFKMEPLVCC